MKAFCFVFLSVFFVACAKEKYIQTSLNHTWQSYERNITKPPSFFQNNDSDFTKALNNSFAQLLENGSNADKTSTYLDFTKQSFELRNLNLLHENDFGVLLFQREILLNQHYVDYSNGLINRYQQGAFIFGLNGFANRVQEQQTYSFTAELGYNQYFKAYTHYYQLEQKELLEHKANIQGGFSFILPQYTPLLFDLNADKEKITYTLHYAPFSFFNLSVTQHRYKNENDLQMQADTKIQLGFKFDYTQSLLKQLKKDKERLFNFDKYEFYQRRIF